MSTEKRIKDIRKKATKSGIWATMLNFVNNDIHTGEQIVISFDTLAPVLPATACDLRRPLFCL